MELILTAAVRKKYFSKSKNIAWGLWSESSYFAIFPDPRQAFYDTFYRNIPSCDGPLKREKLQSVYSSATFITQTSGVDIKRPIKLWILLAYRNRPSLTAFELIRAIWTVNKAIAVETTFNTFIGWVTGKESGITVCAFVQGCWKRSRRWEGAERGVWSALGWRDSSVQEIVALGGCDDWAYLSQEATSFLPSASVVQKTCSRATAIKNWRKVLWIIVLVNRIVRSAN